MHKLNRFQVERVEVKDVKLPQQLQRAMAAEAEATREARAKVIAAEGEQKASRALKEASDVISQSPAALQLRYLQTLSHISAEKNSTVIFPLPIDLLQSFMNKRWLLNCAGILMFTYRVLEILRRVIVQVGR